MIDLPPVDEWVNILLVDDRPENLLALKAVLRCPKYRLVGVNSGEEALSYLLHNDCGFIFMDVQMPTLSGFETAILIRGREISPNIYHFLSAVHREQDYVLRGLRTGALDYLTKPFDPDFLRLKVATLVEVYFAKNTGQKKSR